MNTVRTRNSLIYVVVLFLLVNFDCFGQKKTSNLVAQQESVNRQLGLLQLQYQVKNIDVASVRVFVRYHIAMVLWRQKDIDNSEAKGIIIEAFNDLQKNKATIPELYYREFNSSILAFLESEMPETVVKLKKKFNLENSQDEVESAHELLNKKGGATMAVAKFQKGLKPGQELNPMTIFFLTRLQDEKSPLFPNVLSEILSVAEKFDNTHSIDSLRMLIHFFRDSSVSPGLWGRFISMIYKATQKVIATPGTDFDGAYNLLDSIIPDVERKNSSAVSAQLNAIKNALGIKFSESRKETEEARRKIEESDDKLAETISQAESVESEELKQELFRDAARLALKERKFQLAVELKEKLDISDNKVLRRLHDQFLEDVVTEALKENDTESAQSASSKTIEKLSKASTQQAIGIYYYKIKNIYLSYEAFENALKLISQSEEDISKINAYIRLFSDCLSINSEKTQDIIAPLTKAINSIEPPKADENSEGEDYKRYITSVMQINWNLLPLMDRLTSKNQTMGNDLASRISKKEIKIVCDLAVWANSFDNDSKSKGRKL